MGFSRYDLMQQSKTSFDSEDGAAWPDPLSVNYVQTQFTEIPVAATVSQSDIERFWLFMLKNYNLQDHDDILLTLNNVPYIGLLAPGDTIYKLSKNDIENFSLQVKKQHSL